MKKLYRSERDKKIAGICGGLGEMISIDPTLIRLAVIFIRVATGIVQILFAYIVGWMIIPISAPEQYQDQKK